MKNHNNQIKTSLNSLNLSNDSHKIVNSPCIFLRYLQQGGTPWAGHSDTKTKKMSSR
ncbi:hypothetical protein M153_7560002512 [Pseudoloma neurophilia]|uniref:Uncharacterized protein n=1 Tax=Pseudoloma neurophilia TaxID=146866 RepID=A0A0R0LWL4_9MICR|nr:hypothetical protein M153_7560002512 [Pseudoloma neurophilia]